MSTPGVPITLTPTGVVHGGRTEIFEDRWGTVVSRLILDPAVLDPDATVGLGEFSHLDVIFHFHREARVLRGSTHPRANPPGRASACWQATRPSGRITSAYLDAGCLRSPG